MALNEDGEGWWYICMLLIPFASVEDVISHLLDTREHHNLHGEMNPPANMPQYIIDSFELLFCSVSIHTSSRMTK